VIISMQKHVHVRRSQELKYSYDNFFAKKRKKMADLTCIIENYIFAL
jgi:hypothetical protein